MKHLSLMQPGDLLTYAPSGFFGWLIRAKTWHAVAHVEVFAGDGNSVASRDGKGVGLYPLRTQGLIGIYRPKGAFDVFAAKRWFLKVNGWPYDWKGIMGFTPMVKGGSKGKMFCSEFATEFYRAGGVEPFAASEPADKIAPFQLEISPTFDRIWKKGRT